MAKKHKSKKQKAQQKREEEEHVANSSTLEAIDAMSSDEDGADNDDEMNAEAQALRQAIADGAFDHLLKKQEQDDEEMEQVDMQEQDDNSDETEESSDDDDESDSDDEEVKSDKALKTVLEEMTCAKRGMPWAETFDVISPDPLPFSDNPLDVHDDLKREVAFYNLALEAVKEARNRCNDVGVPFSRPDDFYAEMVKTDGKCG